MFNDARQQAAAEAELLRVESEVVSMQEARPQHGALISIEYFQAETHPDSVLEPPWIFLGISMHWGATIFEARHRRDSEARWGRPGRIRYEEIWEPPLAPDIGGIRRPFRAVAEATFMRDEARFQEVSWTYAGGFNDVAETRALAVGEDIRFLILELPSELSVMAPSPQEVPLDTRAAGSGGNIPVVRLDPTLARFGLSDVSAAFVFPFNEPAVDLFARVVGTVGRIGLIRRAPNFEMGRWVRPEYIRVLSRLLLPSMVFDA